MHAKRLNTRSYTQNYTKPITYSVVFAQIRLIINCIFALGNEFWLMTIYYAHILIYAQTFRHTYNQFKITRANTHPTRAQQSMQPEMQRRGKQFVQFLVDNELEYRYTYAYGFFAVLIRSVALPHYCWVLPACKTCRRRTTPGNLLHWPWAYLKRNLLIFSCPNVPKHTCQ